MENQKIMIETIYINFSMLLFVKKDGTSTNKITTAAVNFIKKQSKYYRIIIYDDLSISIDKMHQAFKIYGYNYNKCFFSSELKTGPDCFYMDMEADDKNPIRFRDLMTADDIFSRYRYLYKLYDREYDREIGELVLSNGSHSNILIDYDPKNFIYEYNLLVPFETKHRTELYKLPGVDLVEKKGNYTLVVKMGKSFHDDSFLLAVEDAIIGFHDGYEYYEDDYFLKLRKVKKQ